MASGCLTIACKWGIASETPHKCWETPTKDRLQTMPVLNECKQISIKTWPLSLYMLFAFGPRVSTSRQEGTKLKMDHIQLFKEQSSQSWECYTCNSKLHRRPRWYIPCIRSSASEEGLPLIARRHSHRLALSWSAHLHLQHLWGDSQILFLGYLWITPWQRLRRGLQRLSSCVPLIDVSERPAETLSPKFELM